MHIWIKKILRKIIFLQTKIKNPILCADMQSLWRKRSWEISKKFINFDYVRDSSLELIAEEIHTKKISGNVAELWVYQWYFASKIQENFPKKYIYLFDTFQWFDKKDLNTEINKKYSNWNKRFENTSIEMVMEKMKYPNNCIIKKWYFPETANNIKDTFCFVSIDADLYEPILAGLQRFYPRLNHGGYIFVHDYNNCEYKWAKQAVQKFCNDQKINYFPLTDNRGTVVIVK